MGSFRVPAADPAIDLLDQGIVLLREALSADLLGRLKSSAERCFAEIERGQLPPERYRFNRFSHSLLLTALLDFGCSIEELLAPLAAPALSGLFSAAMGADWNCNLEQSWARKKFAPCHAFQPGYHPQGWHQDGALGVRFPAEPGPDLEMTELLTCWIPLDSCGEDSPGLEFIRRPQTALLHFTELDDRALRRRFPPQDFYAPALEAGDGLVFLNSVLHRTHTHAAMRRDRLSIEYRIFANQPTC